MTLDDLLAPFHDAEKPASRWRVGTEAEKFGVRLEDGSPLPFEGDGGVRQVLLELEDRHGWHSDREHAAGDVISLRRGDASITLEPGAQLELSGAPLTTIHQTCAEFRGHMAELRDISDELGIAWLGLGFHPLATQAELPWVPKLRYAIMKEYLPTRGSMGLDMMRRTATVQANFDYASEDDAARKLRVSLALSPIVGAMFANSPFVEGRATGERSHRLRVWLDVDPDRSGLLPFAWSDGFRYRDYVEWALDVPMFGFKRGGELIRNTQQTFRMFMTDGQGGHEPTLTDWQTHINTLFPEVRLKNTIEVRSADSQSTPMICAMPALLKGILYEESALQAAEAAVSGLDFATVQAARADIAQRGLRAELAGRELAEWAQQVLEIAEGGLERLSHLDRQGRDERIHLASLRKLVERGMTPADALLEAIDMEQPLLPQLLESGNARL
ncbi:MAG: glutamate--cysteine ligase [Sandaracinaceae bacterium]|nr:glutamate--cysteine ligase [Sandaracinaceae bacterium]